ncbi:AAA family ATPase [Candidatus Aerophobetes bacterium]|nr:AAA family ATPase [Candidatus Aerophobetes bacterium]
MFNRFRPKYLSDIVNQEQAKEMISLEIAAVKNSKFKKKFPHTILMGPSGTGKTTFATAIANELNIPISIVQAKRLLTNKDIFNAIPKVNGNPQYILFIDEIHEMPMKVQEELYMVMEDGILDIRDFTTDYEKLYGEKIEKVAVKGLIVIGATTREGDLEIPFRNRFGLEVYLDKYSPSHIRQIIEKAKNKILVDIQDEVLDEVAKRSRGVPRRALALLERLESVALAEGSKITMSIAKKTWDLLLIDEFGLTRQDYRVLKCLKEQGRMGLKSLTSQTELSSSTIRTIEPYLVQLGLVTRTAKGRKITEKGKQYLKKGVLK